MRQRLISPLDRARYVLRFACLAAPAVLAACDLEEITIVEVEEVVIAEIYVNLAEDPIENEIRAFLHIDQLCPFVGADGNFHDRLRGIL